MALGSVTGYPGVFTGTGHGFNRTRGIPNPYGLGKRVCCNIFVLPQITDILKIYLPLRYTR